MKNLFIRFLVIAGASLSIFANLVIAAPSLPQARQSWASKLVVQGRKVTKFMHKMTPRQEIVGGRRFDPCSSYRNSCLQDVFKERHCSSYPSL